MVLFYFLSHRVIRSVQYGEKPRNRLDMYVPRNHWRMQKGLRPVVIYVTGRLPGVTPEGPAGSHMVEGYSAIAGGHHSRVCSGCGPQRRRSPELGHKHVACMWPIAHSSVTGSTAPTTECLSVTV